MMPVVTRPWGSLGAPHREGVGHPGRLTPILGLGRSAWTHRRSIIACSPGASSARPRGRPSRAGRSCRRRRAARGTAFPRRSAIVTPAGHGLDQDGDEDDVEQAEEEDGHHHPGLEPCRGAPSADCSWRETALRGWHPPSPARRGGSAGTRISQGECPQGGVAARARALHLPPNAWTPLRVHPPLLVLRWSSPCRSLRRSRARAQLGERIDATREKIGKKKGNERVLSETSAAYTPDPRPSRAKIRGPVAPAGPAPVPSSIARRQVLAILRPSWLSAPARSSPSCARSCAWPSARWPQRLMAMYKAEEPDVLTVVLESDGFADLL